MEKAVAPCDDVQLPEPEETEPGFIGQPVEADDAESPSDRASPLVSPRSSPTSGESDTPPPSPQQKRRGRPPCAQSKKERRREQSRKSSAKYRDSQESPFFAEHAKKKRESRARKEDWRLIAGKKDIEKNNKRTRLNLKFESSDDRRHREKVSKTMHFIRGISGGHSEEADAIALGVGRQSKKAKIVAAEPTVASLAMRNAHALVQQTKFGRTQARLFLLCLLFVCCLSRAFSSDAWLCTGSENGNQGHLNLGRPFSSEVRWTKGHGTRVRSQ